MSKRGKQNLVDNVGPRAEGSRAWTEWLAEQQHIAVQKKAMLDQLLITQAQANKVVVGLQGSE